MGEFLVVIVTGLIASVVIIVFSIVFGFCVSVTRGVRSGITEKGLVPEGNPRGDFYRKQLLFSFKKRNKQSAYGTGTAGNKVKCDTGHTTVNVWI